MNQPMVPLTIMGGDRAKKSEAKRPEVVPPITLTSANTTIVVNEPKITGKMIVKSYKLVPPPKILYKIASVKWSGT